MTTGVDKVQTHIDIATRQINMVRHINVAEVNVLTSIASSLLAIALMMKEDHDRKNTEEAGDTKIGFVS